VEFPTPADLELCTDEQLTGLESLLAAERDRRQIAADLPAQVSSMMGLYEEAIGTGGQSGLPSVDDTHTTEDGVTYRSLIPHNITVPLAGPTWWMYWERVGGDPEPDPETGAIPWSGEGAAYTVDTLVTHGGLTYRVRQAHTSQPRWLPPILPALYELVAG
jgi:hypothetical protein